MLKIRCTFKELTRSFKLDGVDYFIDGAKHIEFNLTNSDDYLLALHAKIEVRQFKAITIEEI